MCLQQKEDNARDESDVPFLSQNKSNEKRSQKNVTNLLGPNLEVLHQ
jgi:hypothetical protein